MSSVNITSMYMISVKIIAKHNQAELSKLEYGQQIMFNTRAPGEVTGMTRLKVQVGGKSCNISPRRISDKALCAKHAYQAELKDLMV